ncbi:hypothetical protein 1 [Hubei rhabdo-like virus 3]|uniref:Uncharacterized protein n=1 Tax=Hubei rhabdo-like virus 3 TaxID=1923187 RepID=A0A1L3KMT2_9MONO|nr:hypothetical protein 1 [Hubei rhabdo-like virus 3]APG78688.1 hypothetical protein 1 [Hubei rhabdo-like virus 3]
MSGEKIHALAGSLKDLIFTDLVPSRTDNDEVILKSLKKRTLIAYFLDNQKKRVRINNKLLAYYCAQFYNDTDGSRISDPDLSLSIVGILLSILDPIKTLEAGKFEEGFSLAGYDFEARSLSKDEVNQLCDEDERYQTLSGLIPDFDRTLRERDVWLILSGVLLLTITKGVNPAGYGNWYKKRVAAFSGSLGYPHGIKVLTENTKPLKASMTGNHSFLAASLTLRANIFQIIIQASLLEDRAAAIFRDVKSLSVGCEMSHILMIDEMLYNKYPEIRALRCLSEEHTPMTRAWRYLSTLKKEEALFCKILEPRTKTNVLNRNNFSQYAIAAHAAACFDNPTMKQYVVSGQDNNSTIREVVSTYLEKRAEFAIFAMGSSADARMSSQAEREKFIKSVEADLTKTSDAGGSGQRT